MPFAYMYFVLEYMYDYADWSSHLRCELLIKLICDCCAKFGVCGACSYGIFHVTVMPTGR